MISIENLFGVTGSRMVGTLADQMCHSDAKLGVATICFSGGQGAAGLFELCS